MVSAKEAKATRQQIKKAFGPEAVAVLAALSATTTDLAANLDDLRKGTSTLEAAYADRLLALEADRARLKTLCGRLRWFILG
jgi:hypothetical protein